MDHRTMKAIEIIDYGGIEVMQYNDVAIPSPAAQQVLIKVFAAGVNPIDAKIREGNTISVKFDTNFPHILGWDVSGVVEEVGSEVNKFKLGDSVFGLPRFPKKGSTYAEYVSSPIEHISHKPENIDHIKAASLPIAGLTAWQALIENAELSRGQRVLIHGASGGVGHLAVQIAKWKGAYVIGTASTRNISFLNDIGVDLAIDYSQLKFEDEVSDIDVVLDCVGGETQERSWQIINKNGHLVSIRNAPDQEMAVKHAVNAMRILVRPSQAQLEKIAVLVDGGQIIPYISAVIPLRDAWSAHDLIQRGHTRGKIVLWIRP